MTDYSKISLSNFKIILREKFKNHYNWFVYIALNFIAFTTFGIALVAPLDGVYNPIVMGFSFILLPVMLFFTLNINEEFSCLFRQWFDKEKINQIKNNPKINDYFNTLASTNISSISEIRKKRSSLILFSLFLILPLCHLSHLYSANIKELIQISKDEYCFPSNKYNGPSKDLCFNDEELSWKLVSDGSFNKVLINNKNIQCSDFAKKIGDDLVKTANLCYINYENKTFYYTKGIFTFKNFIMIPKDTPISLSAIDSYIKETYGEPITNSTIYGFEPYLLKFTWLYLVLFFVVLSSVGLIMDKTSKDVQKKLLQ